jgi:hypothetical protein
MKLASWRQKNWFPLLSLILDVTFPQSGDRLFLPRQVIERYQNWVDFPFDNRLPV